jgi:hypothetical protein
MYIQNNSDFRVPDFSSPTFKDHCFWSQPESQTNNIYIYFNFKVSWKQIFPTWKMQKFGPYTLLDPQFRVNFYSFGVQVALSNTIISMCNGSEMMSQLIDCEILQWCTTNFQGLMCVCVYVCVCVCARVRACDIGQNASCRSLTCKNISISFSLADHKSWELRDLMSGHEPQCQQKKGLKDCLVQWKHYFSLV